METRADYVAVGAFVLAILIGIVVAVLWIARVEFRHQFSYYDIYFTGSVTGLAQGSSVSYNGIRVGRVTELRIDPQNLQQVRVTIEVNQADLIRSDAVASLEFQGLTGVATIEITGGSQEAPPLEAKEGQRYPVIASVQSGLQRVVANAPEALSRLIEVADRLSAILDAKNRAAIAETLENIRRVTAVAAGHTGDLDKMVGDSAAAVRELRTTLASATQLVDDLRTLVERGEGRQALKSIDETSRQIGNLAADLDQVVKDNRQPLHDFSQRSLTEFSQLLGETRTLVENLTRLTDEIERDPTRFLFGGNRREGYQPQ